MPKYSTGGGGSGDDGDACELCGRETSNLRRANVAGARLLVCSNCRPHDDSRRESGGSGSSGRGGGSGGGSPGGSSGGDGGTTATESRKKEIARKQAKMYDSVTGDSKRWEEEGTNYEEDRLPYLVSGYGEAARDARRNAGLTVEELSDDLEVDEDDLHAIEDGRAATAGVGGSVVRAVAERLGVELVDE